MSKGSKIVTVRIEEELLSQLEDAVQSQNEHSRGVPDTVSSWIKKCIKEKLAHRQRSNSKKKPLQFRCSTCGEPFDAKSVTQELHDGQIILVTQCQTCIQEERNKDFPP